MLIQITLGTLAIRVDIPVKIKDWLIGYKRLCRPIVWHQWAN